MILKAEIPGVGGHFKLGLKFDKGSKSKNWVAVTYAKEHKQLSDNYITSLYILRKDVLQFKFIFGTLWTAILKHFKLIFLIRETA